MTYREMLDLEEMESITKWNEKQVIKKQKRQELVRKIKLMFRKTTNV